MADLSEVIGMQTGTNFALLKQNLFRWITNFSRGCFPFFQFPYIRSWQTNIVSKLMGACTNGCKDREAWTSGPN